MNRRDFLRWSCTAAGGMLAGRLGGFTALADEDEPTGPNILVLMADGLGPADLSAWGAADAQTPAIDRLVGQGLRFDTFYANAPACSPSRAALATGRYPELIGVPGDIRASGEASFGFLLPQAVTLASLLKSARYRTALVGSWGLGLSRPNLPNARGFDHFQGLLTDTLDDSYTHRRDGQAVLRTDEEPLDARGHATDLFAGWAVDWLKSHRPNQRFFLQLGFTAPQEPVQPPAEYLERVRARLPRLETRRLKMVAQLEHLDAAIGRVLSVLDDLQLADETLVVLTSDHGGNPAQGASVGAWRGGRGSLYEGGLRIPTAIRWPGRVEPGTRSDLVVATMDLMPTLAQAAGIPQRPKTEGRTFLPLLLGRDQPWPERDLFFVRRDPSGLCDGVRRGGFKLLRPRPGAPLELYDLGEDPWERKNLAGRDRRRAALLSAALAEQHRLAATVPWRKG